jgi:hypothetical protein
LHPSLAVIAGNLNFPLFPAAEITENAPLLKLEDQWGG